MLCAQNGECVASKNQEAKHLVTVLKKKDTRTNKMIKCLKLEKLEGFHLALDRANFKHFE